MLALRENAFKGAANPTEFYIGECSTSDWLAAAQDKKEDRDEKVRSLRHMRKYTCSNFLGRLVIVVIDLFRQLTRSNGPNAKPTLTNVLD
jgi:hypothetical protein